MNVFFKELSRFVLLLSLFVGGLIWFIFFLITGLLLKKLFGRIAWPEIKIEQEIAMIDLPQLA